ncbi:MAG: STAS domain-containing protein [Gammaproteobacteria bacterium]|nr:STAS domain-containing protein [Gammaproteobacteria bacterium]
MALPFFKKSKDKAPSPARKPTPAPAAESQPTETLLTMDMGASGIVVEESSGAAQSPVDEVAIFYASGQSDMAERLLKDLLATGDRRAWHMLFDLYGIQNREKDFDQLALDYAMRFETSPPVWKAMGGGNAASKPQPDQTASLELPGLLDKKAAATLREGVEATAKNAAVRIDFSRIAMIDEAGADECAKILAAARKARRKLQVSGVDTLTALLQDLNRATHSRAVHWLLLLELYQTLGQEENFENLAVDYAVRFEVSPPSWSEVQAAEVVQTKPAEPLDDALQLAGEITPANDSALQQLGSYATTHNEVLVDLSQVTRVDYGSVSQFISVLMQCLGSGKTITLRGHNALIHELFRVMGIDQLAQLAPRHRD